MTQCDFAARNSRPLLALAAAGLLSACSAQPKPAHSNASNACTLNEADMQERKALLSRLTHDVIDQNDLPDGLTYRFDPSPDIVSRLAHLVELESDCCQFLTFTIVAERNRGAVWLHVTGPADSQARIHEYFDKRP